LPKKQALPVSGTWANFNCKIVSWLQFILDVLFPKVKM
jgi:hypothetical protein